MDDISFQQVITHHSDNGIIRILESIGLFYKFITQIISRPQLYITTSHSGNDTAQNIIVLLLVFVMVVDLMILIEQFFTQITTQLRVYRLYIMSELDKIILSINLQIQIYLTQIISIVTPLIGFLIENSEIILWVGIVIFYCVGRTIYNLFFRPQNSMYYVY